MIVDFGRKRVPTCHGRVDIVEALFVTMSCGISSGRRTDSEFLHLVSNIVRCMLPFLVFGDSGRLLRTDFGFRIGGKTRRRRGADLLKKALTPEECTLSEINSLAARANLPSAGKKI